MSSVDLSSWLRACCARLEDRQFRRRQLTPRQREVLILMAEGKAGKEIAYRLSISPKTVESHKSAMCSNLQLPGSVHLIRLAVELGLVGPEAMNDDELRAAVIALRKMRDLYASASDTPADSKTIAATRGASGSSLTWTTSPHR